MSVNIGMIGLMATQRLLYGIEDKSYKEDFINLFKKDCHSNFECENYKTDPIIVVRQFVDESEPTIQKTFRVSFKKLPQNYIIENVRPYQGFKVITMDLDFLLVPLSDIVPSKPLVIDFINTVTGDRFSKVFSDFKIEQ